MNNLINESAFTATILTFIPSVTHSFACSHTHIHTNTVNHTNITIPIPMPASLQSDEL